MSIRSKSAARCPRCRMHLGRCICEIIPKHELETRLALVMHRREVSKPTATGPLALEALPNSQLYVQGETGSPLDLRHLHEGRRLIVLFPSATARLLPASIRSEDPRPITLLVPDGNWRQASKMSKRIPGLAEAEHFILPEGRPTNWGIRQENKVGGLATFEAIARAIGLIETLHVQESLEALFDTMVSATFAARGNGAKRSGFRDTLS